MTDTDWGKICLKIYAVIIKPPIITQMDKNILDKN